MKLFLCAVLAVLFANTALAAGACFHDTIGVADGSGNYIRMQSGLRFQVYPGKNRPVIFWTPLDKVVICPRGGAGYTISNLARHDEVPALRLFP